MTQTLDVTEAVERESEMRPGRLIVFVHIGDDDDVADGGVLTNKAREPIAFVELLQV